MDFLYDLCGKPFGWIMRLIYDWVDNYAFAILLFTIFTKLILFPISYKQQMNSAKMQIRFAFGRRTYLFNSIERKVIFVNKYLEKGR